MGNTSFPKGLATLTWLVKVRRGNPTVLDWGRPKNGQLWTKNGRLVQSIPKGTKTVYLSDFWPFGTLLGPSWRGWLSKLKICKEANHTLLLKRLQNNFFGSRPLQLANISQILSFIRTTEQNKTISDGGITVYFWIVKVQTSNRSSNSWGSLNSWGSSNNWDPQIVGDHIVPLDH